MSKMVLIEADFCRQLDHAIHGTTRHWRNGDTKCVDLVLTKMNFGTFAMFIAMVVVIMFVFTMIVSVMVFVTMVILSLLRMSTGD